MMSRLTIRAKLILLSGALLCMLIATNLYLTRTLSKNSTAVTKETELSTVIETANGARIAFGEMRYWLTDLAVSLLTSSERDAAAAGRSADLSLVCCHRLLPATQAQASKAACSVQARMRSRTVELD